MTTPDAPPPVAIPDARPPIYAHLAKISGIERDPADAAPAVSGESVIPSAFRRRMGGVEMGGVAVGADSSGSVEPAAAGTGGPRAYGKLLEKSRTGVIEPAPTATKPEVSDSTHARESLPVTPRNPLVAEGPHGSFLEAYRTSGRYVHGMTLVNRDSGAVWTVEGVIKDPRTGKVSVVLQPPDGGPTINKPPDLLDSQLAEKDGAWRRL